MPRDGFYDAPGRRSGRTGWCRECMKAYSKGRDRSHDRKPVRKTHGNLYHRTGATMDWRATQWMKQDGKCDACDDPVDLDGGWRTHVDHIEVDGVKIPVGVLHNHCNTGIGKADHSPEKARAWADYLERTR